MGIIKTTSTSSNKPPEDYAVGAASVHQQQQQNGIMNPLAEDSPAAQVHQNLLNKRRVLRSSSSAAATSRRRCGLGSWLAQKSGGTHEHWGQVTVANVVFYILCVAALGCSVYLNYRQSFLEERLRYMHHLDERLTDVEARLNSVFHLQSQSLEQQRNVLLRRRVSPSAPLNTGFAVSSSNTNQEPRAATLAVIKDSISDREGEDDEDDDDEDGEMDLDDFESSDEENFEDVKSVVKKLSLQVQGIQRLRRDVSQLKLTRQQRQTAIEQSPEDMCSCPPGELMRLGGTG